MVHPTEAANLVPDLSYVHRAPSLHAGQTVVVGRVTRLRPLGTEAAIALQDGTFAIFQQQVQAQGSLGFRRICRTNLRAQAGHSWLDLFHLPVIQPDAIGGGLCTR